MVMFGEKGLSNALSSEAAEQSQSKLSRHITQRNRDLHAEKIGVSEKNGSHLRESDMGAHGFPLKPLKIAHSGSQELTFSYLCDNSKSGFLERDLPGRNSSEKVSYKGKEVVTADSFNGDNKWVERDFLNLNEKRENSSKREVAEDVDRGNREKRPKLETLNLSLALPDPSLSLTASNALQNEDLAARSKPTMSLQSLAPSNNNTKTTCSNDFTAASLSYSYSHPFSHNPSCSLTHNSTEHYECSAGRDEQIWNCGEGTNGSVHSRFKPLGDGVTLSNHGSSLFSMMQGYRMMNKDSQNNHNLLTSSENHSFLPSELPARLRIETPSGDSRGRNSENLVGLEGVDAGRARKLSRPERILREIVFESIPTVSQTILELTAETLSSTKNYLKNLIEMPENREELVTLQRQLGRRSDFSKETLLKCQREHLEILLAIKMGLVNFIDGKTRTSIADLADIFLLLRCRNCQNVVPVDDCDCKICSSNKGFCSSCMCPVCLNFDCANNTCSWVGCDVCSHWCHAACGIQKKFIRPGPSLKGKTGTTQMQFHCIACGHASELFGFVKDVFLYCAKDWGHETLTKELECVKNIFRGSEDLKGKELFCKAEEMVSKLNTRIISAQEACKLIIQFFNYADVLSDFPTSDAPPKELPTAKISLGKKETAPFLQSASKSSPYTFENMRSCSGQSELLSNDHHHADLKAEKFSFNTSSKNEGLDSLESIVRIKEAEARMFQNKADDARREAEGLQRIIIAKTRKLEEDYGDKLAKLSVETTEKKRRKKVEELKVIENSHFDYCNMKKRMQTEITGLLQRMEATKKQLI